MFPTCMSHISMLGTPTFYKPKCKNEICGIFKVLFVVTMSNFVAFPLLSSFPCTYLLDFISSSITSIILVHDFA